MSEEIWTNVKVKVPADWVPDPDHLPGALGGLADYLVEGGADELEVEGGVAVIHFAGISNYGLAGVSEYLDELERLRIPFEASDEPKYEYEGETVFFNGERYFHSRSGGEGEQLLDLSIWRLIVEGKHDWAPDVETYFTKMPGLSDANIDHLLGTPSPFEEPDE